MSTRRSFSSLLLSLVVCGSLGCGKSPEARYVPDTNVARQSLEAALNAWKNGEARESVKLQDKPISLTDSRWQSGKKLESFEILEETPANPFPSFKVKTQFATESDNEETVFLVIGIDPLLIYRSQDFERERSAY
jgi:hypothetical protein